MTAFITIYKPGIPYGFIMGHVRNYLPPYYFAGLEILPLPPKLYCYHVVFHISSSQVRPKKFIANGYDPLCMSLKKPGSGAGGLVLSMFASSVCHFAFKFWNNLTPNENASSSSSPVETGQFKVLNTSMNLSHVGIKSRVCFMESRSHAGSSRVESLCRPRIRWTNRG